MSLSESLGRCLALCSLSGPLSAVTFGVVRPTHVVLLLILIIALPTWPYRRTSGDYPSGVASLIILWIVIMLVTGRPVEIWRRGRSHT